MGRSDKALAIVYPEGQKYACRDCPARCCTGWAIPVSADEQARILGDDEARARLGARSTAILRSGVLPMRQHDTRLACVFLDEDLLCSLHKRHGHAFLPASCQTYPFGFSQNEKKQKVALLSRYCPSIRDNYGEPVGAIVGAKWHEAGGVARPMADKMGLRSGRVLPLSQYVEVVRRWQEILQTSDDPSAALVRAYLLTDAVDEALPKAHKPNDREFSALLEQAPSPTPQALAKTKVSFQARLLVAHLLGGLCYPSRVMLPHRPKSVTFGERIGSWMNRLAWLFGWGRVDLLFVEAPVEMKRARRVPPFLTGPLGRVVSAYLVEVLGRRQGMTKQTYLSRLLVDLALMTIVISRYARAAASTARGQVEEAHVREAIGIAELLFSHQGEGAEGPVLAQLRLTLMANPDDYQRLLAGEAVGSP